VGKKKGGGDPRPISTFWCWKGIGVEAARDDRHHGLMRKGFGSGVRGAAQSLVPRSSAKWARASLPSTPPPPPSRILTQMRKLARSTTSASPE